MKTSANNYNVAHKYSGACCNDLCNNLFPLYLHKPITYYIAVEGKRIMQKSFIACACIIIAIMYHYWYFSYAEMYYFPMHFFYYISHILTADVSVGSKMLRKLTPENVIAFTKLSLVISLSWPLPAVATKRQVVLFRVLRFLIYVNIWCLFVPLFMTLQDWNERPDICVKSIPLIAGSAQAFIEMWICHGQHKHFQVKI